MSRYRKIDVRIWNDEKFRDLSDAGQLAFLFILTHPNMTSIGAMRATIPGLAAEKGWSAEAFREAFAEGLSKGMIEFEERAACVALPNFLKYNQPESPNVVKAWEASLDLVPEGDLKSLTVQRAKAFLKGKTKAFAEALPKAFAEALPKTMPKTMPYQEQEKEPEKEPKEGGREVEGYTLRSRTREGYDVPFSAPASDDDAREWLTTKGVHLSRVDEAMTWLMRDRLYADRLETFMQPVSVNSYAAAKGKVA